MPLNPEADEISPEDLAAASDMYDRLAQSAFEIDEDRFGPQD